MPAHLLVKKKSMRLNHPLPQGCIISTSAVCGQSVGSPPVHSQPEEQKRNNMPLNIQAYTLLQARASQ
jgi:hypothetical protein